MEMRGIPFMFDRILIANRGEIAVRVIRTCRQFGVETVAVHSDVDRDALHVAMADLAVQIGGAAPGESYLRGDRIIEAALATGAQAIHPGYGFLSENPEFVEAVEAAGLVFIGPGAAAIRAMGLKDAAKRLMAEAGVPVVPGYHGADQEPGRLEVEAAEVGYPVLIKALALPLQSCLRMRWPRRKRRRRQPPRQKRRFLHWRRSRCVLLLAG
jgi:3-methylcrotonyl-CoA carboxylase alpha subunit